MWPAVVAAVADRLIRYMEAKVQRNDNALTTAKYRRRLLAIQQRIAKRQSR